MVDKVTAVIWLVLADLNYSEHGWAEEACDRRHLKAPTTRG